MTHPTASCLTARSQLEVQLLDYLRTLQKRADERLMPGRDDRVPRYYEERPPHSVYVWPDVIKTVRRERPNRSDDKDQAPSDVDRTREPGSSLPGVTTEPGQDDPRRYDDEYTTERVPWLRVVERAASQHRPFRALILGIAGQGKSWLTQMTTAKLANQAYQLLDDFTAGPTDLAVPICLRLPDFVDRCQGLKGDAEQQVIELCSHIEAMLVDDGCGPHAGHFIAQHLLPKDDNPVGTVPWLFLDALDEVANDKRSALDQLLQTMDKWPCPVVITGRPWAKEKIPPGLSSWQEHAVFELAAFMPQQSQSLVHKWFAGGSVSARDMFCDRLRQGGYRALAKVPLFLTQLCALADRGGAARLPAPKQATSGALYSQILEEMFGELPAPDPEAGDTHLKISFQKLRAVVYYLAWRMTCRPKTPIPWIQEADALKRIREEVTNQKLDLKPDAVLATLVKARLLVPENSNHGAPFVFAHLDLGAYLAGAHLAEVVNEEGWEGHPTVQSLQPNRVYRVHDWLCAAIWDPNIEPVVAYALGEIKYGMAGPVLETLEAETLVDPDGEVIGQDILDYRLTALARCFRQVRVNEEDVEQILCSTITAVLKRVTKRCLGNLLAPNHIMFHRPLEGQRSDLALDTLIEVTLRYGGLDGVVETLIQCESQQESQWNVRRTATKALGYVSALLPKDDPHLNKIVETLIHRTSRQENNKQIRHAMAEALSRVSASLLQADPRQERIIETLIHRVLEIENDNGVRCTAAEALGRISTLLPRDDLNLYKIIETLIQHASEQESDEDVRRTTAEALGRTSASLHQGDPHLNRIFATLIQRTSKQESHWNIHRTAVESLGRVSASFSQEDPRLDKTIETLIQHASEQIGHWNVRHAATEALGRVCAQLSKEDPRLSRIIETLISLASLQESDGEVCLTAAEMLGHLSALLSKEDPRLDRISETLIRLASWREPRLNVRRIAVEALSCMAASLPQESTCLDRIIETLIQPASEQEPYWNIYRTSAGALGRISATLTKSDPRLDRIIEMLIQRTSSQRTEDVRRAACEALGRMSAPLLKGDPRLDRIIETLIKCTSGWSGLDACRTAYEALGRVSASLPQEDPRLDKIIEKLIQRALSNEGYWDVYQAAVEALDTIIVRRLRLFRMHKTVRCIPLDVLIPMLCPIRTKY